MPVRVRSRLSCRWIQTEAGLRLQWSVATDELRVDDRPLAERWVIDAEQEQLAA